MNLEATKLVNNIYGNVEHEKEFAKFNFKDFKNNMPIGKAKKIITTNDLIDPEPFQGIAATIKDVMKDELKDIDNQTRNMIRLVINIGGVTDKEILDKLREEGYNLFIEEKAYTTDYVLYKGKEKLYYFTVSTETNYDFKTDKYIINTNISSIKKGNE